MQRHVAMEGIFMEKYYKKWFLPLTLPSILLFVGVILVPFIMGGFYSFTGWMSTFFMKGKVVTQNPFEALVGLKNYKDALANQQFQHAFWYSVKFTIIAVVVINLIALLLALLLTKVSRGAGLFRTVFFMPNLLGGLALGFIWKFIFEVIFSKIFFGPDGLFPISALVNMTQGSKKPLIALVIMVAWQMAGYMMIIFVTGLNNIPRTLYEAAEIDGAGLWWKFRSITLPMLMPAFTIVLFLTMANCFELLDQNIALTDGAFNTRMLALQVLRTPGDMSPPNFGQAQAQAVIFFVVIAIVTLVQVVVTKRQEVEM